MTARTEIQCNAHTDIVLDMRRFPVLFHRLRAMLTVSLSNLE